jgi:phage-related holin
MSNSLKYPAMLSENILATSLSSLWSQVVVLFIAYFSPIAEMVHVMIMFLVIDTISGICASLKNGDKFEAKKLVKTVVKFVWYSVAVMTAWMMEKTFGLCWISLAKLVAGFISFVELKSIFENITGITNEPVFKRILKMLKRKGSETIDEITNDENDGKD